ncbi:MAG TPA: EamA family transporter [Candidatus Deferrimicrobiaceae bacterium]|nr:EamA family transporter [Candidatus Deferrimicrobiaceae bacterium]
MPDKALLFILLSSVMHAGWNLILKTSRRKLAFNVFMHGSAIAIFSAWWIARHGGIPFPRGPVLLFTLAGGFFFSLYHMCLTAAYERIDVSLAYPLTTTGPLYIPLWAYLFLGERLSAPGLAGIFVVALGAYLLQMQEISWVGLVFPLRNIRLPGVLLALSAGVFYSVGAIVDKQGVTVVDVFLYTYYLDIVLFLFLLANVLLTPSRIHFLEEVRGHWARGMLAGAVLFASFLLYRIGLQMAKVSYATSVRQASAIVGVLGGILLFRERFGRIRLFGAALIALGVVCIKLG